MLLLKEYERFLLHCTLTLRANRMKGVALELTTTGPQADALTVIERAFKAGRARHEFGKDDVLRITAVDRTTDPTMVVILMRRGDPDAAAQVFEHRKTGELRRADKTEDDMVAVSCHLFVQLRRLTGGEPAYAAMLEEVPGIARSHVQTLLTTILERHNYSYVNDRGHEKETFTRALLDGVKGEKLGSDGTVKFDTVELVRPAEDTGLDMPTFVPKEQRLRFKVQPDAPDMVDKLKALKSWALGEGWQDIRIRVRMPEGKSRVVSFREADAADVLFVRAAQVPLKKAMDPCSDLVNPELLGFAATYLKEQS
ncbi:hypothetical protein [Devosia sp. Root105]|uniref:hypothetical protein n=1 Tax=Devosia sp. Root105 TaxID=1736423 RepID=UPI0006F89142|nr:hypothetical protein [Devosia sp. Root105]KQU95211.1 hypothetical protein ASC68_18845 [Devosia sp. Root105]